VKVPELLGEFEGYVFPVMKLLVKFSFEFLVDSIILLACHHVGLGLEESESGDEPYLFGAK
jgi:hypothetical protein